MDLLNCQMRNMALRQPLNGLKVSKDAYNKLFFINTHSIDATFQVGMIISLFTEIVAFRALLQCQLDT